MDLSSNHGDELKHVSSVVKAGSDSSVIDPLVNKIVNRNLIYSRS